jgi:hypothetical protein
MMTRCALPFACGLAILTGLGTIPARAAQIAEPFTLGTINGFSEGLTETSSSFAMFDPARGTLTGVTVKGTIDATFSGGTSSNSSTASYFMYVSPSPFNFEVNVSETGNGSVSQSFSDTDTAATPPLAVLFVGSGTLSVGLELYSTTATGVPDLLSQFSDLSVVYTYTPVTLAPEPLSISLLATSMLGLAVFGRRQRHARPD